ncbi:MAG: DMT family transporter [Janthinobacterium lividum]
MPQLLMSLLIDNFGWLGNRVIPLGGSRIAAMVLLAPDVYKRR